MAGISRGLILAALDDAPGRGFNELARLTGLARGTLAGHLRILLQHELVWTVRHGDRLLHFRAPRPDEAGVRRLIEAHVLDGFDRAVLAFVREAPRAQKAVLDHFGGRARSTVQHRLSRLVEWRFVVVRVVGRYRVYARTDQG